MAARFPLTRIRTPIRRVETGRPVQLDDGRSKPTAGDDPASTAYKTVALPIELSRREGQAEDSGEIRTPDWLTPNGFADRHLGRSVTLSWWALVGSHHALPVFSRTQRLRLLSAHILLAGRARRRSRAPRPSVLETDVLLLKLPAYFRRAEVSHPTPHRGAIRLRNGDRAFRFHSPSTEGGGPDPHPLQADRLSSKQCLALRGSPSIASARLERAISSFAKRCPVQLDDEAV